MLCAWNGREEVAVEGRRVLVDDDTWLLVPQGPATCQDSLAAQRSFAMTILFRPGMPEEVLGALMTPEDRMLEDGEVVTGQCLAVCAASADA